LNAVGKPNSIRLAAFLEGFYKKGHWSGFKGKSSGATDGFQVQ